MKMNFSFNYDNNRYTAENLKDGKILLCDGVTVKLVCEEFKEFDACYHYLEFENQSGKDSGIFSEIYDCDSYALIEENKELKPGYMPNSDYIFVTSQKGMVDSVFYKTNDEVSSEEYSFCDSYLAKGKTLEYKVTSGLSSDELMPFFDVHAKDSGIVLAIGWTGGWKANFSNLDDGVNIKTGLLDTNFYLENGEKIRTSSVLVMEYTKSEDKYNKFRSLIRKYFSHKTKKPHLKDGLLAFELWGGLSSNEMIKRINEMSSHNINFEEYWIDAGWYGQCTKCDDAFAGDWFSHTGDWSVNKNVHPKEFTDVRDAINRAGAKMMLWFEPERALIQTPVYKNHPEWFINDGYPNGKCRVLYYGNKDALEYTKNLISDYIEKLNIGCYRQDFNTKLAQFTKYTDTENRTGITEIKHINGLYELLDYLNEKYPELIIDNCCSGGRRIDIETLSRSIPFFRSDYQCAFNANGEVTQTHNVNISRYLPYNGCTTKSDLDIYDVRSTYSSSWGAAYYSTIHNSMNEEKFEIAKQLLDEYLKIRPYLSKEFYNYGTEKFDETSWVVYQYHDAEKSAGVILAFRRKNSPFKDIEISLSGLKENEKYSFYNFDTKESFESGREITITLNQKRSSVIIEYKNS